MTEGTYEYECMRAELLGLPIPDEEEFLFTQQERIANHAEELEGKAVEALENETEDLKNVSGGLDELNSILSITQKKLNKFKTACGSLTNLLKIKVGQSDSTESIPMKESDDKDTEDIESSTPQSSQDPVQNGARKSDMSKSLDNQVDKLESLLEKADNAQYKMAHQTKQMKSFLK